MVMSETQIGSSGKLPLDMRLDQISTPLTLPSNRLFGTDGIRGKVGEVLTAKLALQVGFVSGKVLKGASGEGVVVVGQDSRNSSNMLSSAIAAGLMAAGVEVWNLGLCPTPAVATATRQTEAIGGIMISASHNPPEDNGIKLFSSQGTKLDQQITANIEARIRQIYQHSDLSTIHSSVQWGKQYNRPELVQAYVQRLQQTLPAQTDLNSMRIVLDLAWGAAVETAPQIFRNLGAEVICLHSTADGGRINVNCGSTHLSQLQTAVLEHGADLGFAFDGDADRVMATDSQGRVVDGDYILYLWGQQLKQQGLLPDNLIVATVMANLGFERAWLAQGGKFKRTAVGDQHVQAEMWRTGAMLGGEQSGHIICHHHGVSGDGIQTAIHLAALVQQQGVSLAELINCSFSTYPQQLKNVRVADYDCLHRWQECEAINQAIAFAQATMGDQGRVLVRASGTEPLLRVMVEARTADLVSYWSNYLVEIVKQHLK